MITADPILLQPRTIRYYADHILDYVKEVIGATPDDNQALILQSLHSQPRTSARSGHGVGKSTVESWGIKWFMYSRPFPKVPCTAPTQHQLHDILWAELNKWNRQSADGSLFEWTDERFYHKAHREEWFAVPRTATKPDALQGFHADHILFILDEASGVPDKVFEPVLGALSTEGAKLLACGNPTQLSGWFFDSHNSKRDMYSVFHIDGRNSSRVDAAYVAMIIAMYGEDSDVFRVRVAGEFPKALPDSFIPLEWAERNSSKNIVPVQPRRIDIGIDVARFGDDQSVLCPVFNKRQQQQPEIFHHNDTMQISGHTVQMLDRYTDKHGRIPMSVRVDCDGLGVGVYDRVSEVVRQRRWNHVRMHEGHFGGAGGKVTAEDPVRVSNSTGLMWGAVREKLRTDALELWYNDRQISELSNRKYRVNSDGEIELEKKEEMKKRVQKSPDLADALCLAVYEPPVMDAAFQM
ncbi:MAG: terminase [Negativicutes bacterium]